MTFPNDENGSVLAEMQEAGIDLSKSLTVEFFQLFEQEKDARALAEFVQNSDMNAVVNVHPDQTPNVWDVDCQIEMVPSYENIVAMEEKFEKLANKFNGFNDGWGVQQDD
ncbi:ribonuclease E inhibitor RraB [Thalassotalea nanhaiensis]|uniref:Ribonuclease E inhibitor RraB n=1 Tax=Thalassotalea nanhaiensis TaxID=3065648 RepID=A0ABY9TNJ2_9GAMM|nr:ribonuclease E inhibitor RraB [Colwelliaceae bacterium SQ345]